MKKLIPLIGITAFLSASATELNTPIDLECDIHSVTPSELQNPKAEDWWQTHGKLDGVELYINTQGVNLIGAMVNKTWDTYNGEVTDWYVKIKFGHQGPKYHFINLSTLTGSGFFYVDYDSESDDNDPNYTVKCRETIQEEIQVGSQ